MGTSWDGTRMRDETCATQFPDVYMTDLDRKASFPRVQGLWGHGGRGSGLLKKGQGTKEAS